MTNQRITVFYTGISGNLRHRQPQHKYKLKSGFTKKYNINRLVYYECFDNPTQAIAREKQIKGWTRKKKIDLIKTINPEFKNLSEDWMKLWAIGL